MSEFKHGKALAVVFAMGLAVFVVVFSVVQNQDVPIGVSGILSSMNAFAIVVWGGIDLLKIWKGSD